MFYNYTERYSPLTGLIELPILIILSVPYALLVLYAIWVRLKPTSIQPALDTDTPPSATAPLKKRALYWIRTQDWGFYLFFYRSAALVLVHYLLPMELPIVALEVVSNPFSDLVGKAVWSLCEPFDPWLAVPLAFLVDFPAFYLFYRRISIVPSPLWSSFIQSVVFAVAQVVMAFIYRPMRPQNVTTQSVHAASKQKAD